MATALALEFGSSLDVPLALVICSTLQTKKNETRGREAPERSFYLNEPGTLAKMSIYYVEIGFWAPQVKEHEDKTRIENLTRCSMGHSYLQHTWYQQSRPSITHR